MSKTYRFAHLLFIVFTIVRCSDADQRTDNSTDMTAAEHSSIEDSSVVYQSEILTLRQVATHTYIHTSLLPTEEFGKVACNGMVVVKGGEAVVFDTPADSLSSEVLIDQIQTKLHASIRSVIPTHFHEDCLGGIDAFRAHNIPAFASNKTLALLTDTSENASNGIHGFNDSLTMHVGDAAVHIAYLGEGHTRDNVIGFFPTDSVLFGGCLIKRVGAGKGFLGDANIDEWPITVSKIRDTYTSASIVIPGHGAHGGRELLDYTIQLFE